jgi:monovalent cation/hydrogen antiporter
VISVTLTFQGMTLPLVIRLTGVEDDGSTAYEELIARKTAARAAIDRLEMLSAEEWTRDDTVERMTGMYEFRYRRLSQRAATFKGRELEDGDEDLEERSFTYQRTVHDVIAAQRTAIVGLRDEGQISDGVMHLLERELDLEEERLEI